MKPSTTLSVFAALIAHPATWVFVAAILGSSAALEPIDVVEASAWRLAAAAIWMALVWSELRTALEATTASSPART